MALKLYVVGGYVRDLLLGLSPKDVDFAVIAPDYVTMREQFIDSGGHIYEEQPPFGRLRGRLKGVDGDFLLARKEGFYVDGRHPSSICPVQTIEEDLHRRDFTINAMAIPVSLHDTWLEYQFEQIIDLFDGKADLKNRVLRFVGNPIDRLTEDALRLARYYRFQVQLYAEPEKTLPYLIEQSAEQLGYKLGQISVDRRKTELYTMFKYDTPKSIKLLATLPSPILRNWLGEDEIKLSPVSHKMKSRQIT